VLEPTDAAVGGHRLFQRLRRRLLANTSRQLVFDSPLRFLTIFLCSALVWGFVFGFSFSGFHYFKLQNIILSGALVGTVFDLLFLTLTVLLIFSTGIILYSSLFGSAEASFLLSLPASSDQVFAYKFQSAVAFSSWAFVILGSPVLIGYGLVEEVPWYFYALLPLFFIGFILVPGSLGALACLLIVNFLPRRRRQVLVAGGLLVLLAVGLLGYNLAADTQTDAWNRELLNRLLGRVRFSQGPFVPSHWMTRGLQAAGRGQVSRSAYYLALVWSNGLFLYVASAWLSARLYRRGYDRVATGGDLRRRYGGQTLDGVLNGLLSFLSPQLRLLIVKDFRTFRRDPAQWAQILILTGLMTIYLANVRRLYIGEIGEGYQNGISLLNLAATGLLLSAYTGRFIYPMLSLEGRKFWILGLLPLRRESLLWGKFAFSATGGLLISEFLILLGDVMLGLPALAVALHTLTVAVLAVGLSGLSVGLGACMPNFRETDPSKIAVGFGGTLNLVAGLLFLLVTIGLIALPWHLQTAAERTAIPQSVLLRPWALAFPVALGLLLGTAVVVFPLRAGTRALRRMEF
jgi:ABC-2 type transport system permease protein